MSHPATAAVNRAIEAAAEAATVAELEHAFMPEISRALGAHETLVFAFDGDGLPLGLTGTLGRHMAFYNAEMYRADPLQRALKGADAVRVTVALGDVLTHEDYRQSGAYRGFYQPLGVDDLLCLWPMGRPYGAPDMVGLLFGREGQRPYGRAERRLLERCLPAVRAVVRRERRAQVAQRRVRAIELALDAVAARPTVVVDARGDVQWASRDAERLLARSGVEPARLGEEAARIGRRGHTAFAISGLAGQVRAAPAEGGFVLELEDHERVRSKPLLEALARRHGLTRSEQVVLEQIGRGLDNEAIARALFVSLETVKTHSKRVLSKLGVQSRTQAALIAHGIAPQRDP